MQQSNIFNKRRSLFDVKKVVGLNFSKGLNSIDLEQLNFTNYCSSKECKEYLKIKEFYDKVQNNKFKFLEKDFESSEYNKTNPQKNKRLITLIKTTINENIEDKDLNNIIKYKNRDEKGIQLFIKYSKELDSGELYLVDLYHFAIPTEDKRFNQRKKDTKQHYCRVKKKVKHNVNLSETKNN